ncbi:MAG: GTP-binding protein [Promethearchaeota archaeon]|nr:MAG: GTP-binding protein [Candidatus Lokiarchaeota archaeon]
MDIETDIVRYKMILFGDMAVGKTSLVERFVNDKFEENYISTLGYNVYQKQIDYCGNIISLMIYDIGGQERFTDLRRKYAQGADTAFIIYDITNQESFSNVLKWKQDLDEMAGKIPFIIIGNKLDLGEHRQVSKDQALQLCSERGAMAFFETSAKDGKGVEDAFIQLAVETFKTYSIEV